MNEENKLQMEVRSDEVTKSFGSGGHQAVRDGDFSPRGYRNSVYVMICLVILIFAGMFFSKNPPPTSQLDRELPTPGIYRDGCATVGCDASKA